VAHVTTGASEANALVVAALAGAEGEILVERPGYQPMRRAPLVFGTRVRTFDRFRSGGILAAIEAELTPRTWVISIADLHNPTGAPLAESDARALDELAERRGLWIHCDKTFRDADARPLGTWSSTGRRWVTTSTLTKCYGLGGLRLGWICAHEEAMSRCEAVHRGLSAEPSHLSAALALQLSPHFDALRARTHAILRVNHARWSELAARRSDLACGPAHGLTVWCGFPGKAQGDAFAAWALEHHDLALHPGRFFDDSSGVRVTLGGEPGDFAAALERFDRATAEFLAGSPAGGEQ
jgi:aspartate/methionine/tyrosine aminotransferase